MQLQRGCAVIDSVAYHGANHAKIVDAGADIRKQVAHCNPALPILLVRPLRFQQAADAVFSKGESALEWDRLAIVFLKARLGVERVDAGGSAVHVKEDDALGLRREVRRFWREQI